MVGGPEVVGRAVEVVELKAFLDAVSAGPRVLVVEGEPGIGKTTLWQEGVDAARERSCCVLVCRPSEAEAKLGYAALGDLLESVRDETLAELDEPQRRAIDVALLRSEPGGSKADPRAVSVGLLNVLRLLARSRPVVVALEDVQWLDAASVRAIEFALRRLDDEPVGLLASQRSGVSRVDYERLVDGRVERLTVGPLPRYDVDQLLRRRMTTPLDRHTTNRIHRLSGGNPFYALEIARSLEAQDDPVLDDRLAIPASLHALVGARVAALPPSTRRALLAASALAVPMIETIAAAGGRRDHRVPALEAAEAAGVVDLDLGVVRFTHPLLASAVYADASSAERRAVHRRLAQVVFGSEEGARHLALSAEGPDATIADVLDAAARSARRRGALDEAVDFAERARQLTPRGADDDRHRRQVDAASYHYLAGDMRRASQLAQDAAACLPAGAMRGRALFRFATITADAGAARERLVQALLEAEGDDGLSATIEGALVMNYMREFDASTASAHAHAGLARARRASDQGVLASSLMDVAWSDFYLGRGVSRELVQQALALESACDPTPVRRLPRTRYAMMLHLSYELDAARSGYEGLVEMARMYGDEPSVANILGLLSEVECFAGRYELASEHAAAAHRIAVQCESERLLFSALNRMAMVTAHQGYVDEAHAACAEVDELMQRSKELHAVGAAAWVRAFLELSLGNAQGAIDQIQPLARALVDCDVIEPMPILGPIPDLIEALVAVGDLDEASSYLAALHRRAEASRNSWALVTAARSRALLEAAEGRLDEALAATEVGLCVSENAPMPFERARTLLVRGIVQRRAKQRRPARESMLLALGIFEDLGARLWADRARREIARIGGRATGDDLTPTEAQVAARAAAGETNREIASALFMSVKTVEANLSRVYRKLDISSRRQLDESLKQQT